MANNRLWAVCIDDNDARMVTKYYPCDNGWGYLEGNKDYVEEFMTKHAWCKSNQGCGENIIFCTEQNDPRIEKYDFTKSHEGITKIYLKNANI